MEIINKIKDWSSVLADVGVSYRIRYCFRSFI